MCYICGDGGNLILCDGSCERAYHMECLNLKSIPDDEEWFCPYCLRQLAKKGHKVEEVVEEEDSEEYYDTNKEKMEKLKKLKAKKKKDEDEAYTVSQKTKPYGKNDVVLEGKVLCCPVDGCSAYASTRTSLLSHVYVIVF